MKIVHRCSAAEWITDEDRKCKTNLLCDCARDTNSVQHAIPNRVLIFEPSVKRETSHCYFHN